METLMGQTAETFIKQNIPEENILRSMANFYSIFSDSTRVKILMALSISEMCVGDVAQILNLNQSTLSHQLKLLRDAKIIDCRREGKIIYYFNINPFINDIMLTGIDNLDNENGDYKFA